MNFLIFRLDSLQISTLSLSLGPFQNLNSTSRYNEMSAKAGVEVRVVWQLLSMTQRMIRAVFEAEGCEPWAKTLNKLDPGP